MAACDLGARCGREMCRLIAVLENMKQEVWNLMQTASDEHFLGDSARHPLHEGRRNFEVTMLPQPIHSPATFSPLNVSNMPQTSSRSEEQKASASSWFGQVRRSATNADSCALGREKHGSPRQKYMTPDDNLQPASHTETSRRVQRSKERAKLLSTAI
eukprot:4600329-Pleurochrysis_carterae.AAC.3